MVKSPPTNAGDIRDMGLIPGSGRSPAPVFLPGNDMDRGAWRAMVHRIVKSKT